MDLCGIFGGNPCGKPFDKTSKVRRIALFTAIGFVAQIEPRRIHCMNPV